MTEPLKQRCGCGPLSGTIRQRTAIGRMHQYRFGLFLMIPEDFPIYTCTECGETYQSEAECEALTAVLRPAYLAWQQRHVKSLLETLHMMHPEISLRDITLACGVFGLHLQEVVKGEAEAEMTTIYLLETYVRNPDELKWRIHAIRTAMDFGLEDSPDRPRPPW
jgi:hypothetical protein